MRQSRADGEQTLTITHKRTTLFPRCSFSSRCLTYPLVMADTHAASARWGRYDVVQMNFYERWGRYHVVQMHFYEKHTTTTPTPAPAESKSTVMHP